AKLCLITKLEFGLQRQYGFISTGNFNEVTANFYADYCLLTAHKQILADVQKVFSFLENHAKQNSLKGLKHLVVTPLTMRATWLQLIDNEIQHFKAGKPARVIIKLDSLVDAALMEKLSEAATVGVPVQLIVRRICCQITESKKYKQAIQAISIVDEYLEHARVFAFENAGKPKVFISSADWMIRNLDRRIEVACPVLDKKLKQELLKI